MIVTSTLLAAVLATSTPWVVRRVSSEPVRPWWPVAVPMAGAMGGLLGWAIGHARDAGWPMTIAVAVVAAILAQQMVLDLAVRRLPRVLSHVALAVFVVGAALDRSRDTTVLRDMLIGAVLLTAITGILMVISRGSLGMGDLQLSPLLGAIVGWFSPSAVFTMWIVTAILGALVVVIGMVTTRIDRRSVIPYGPPMIVGTFVAVCVAAVS